VTDDLNGVMKTMMKLAGVSSKYADQCSLQEFIRQSDNYQELDRDNLNQVYKFLLYNGGQGVMLSHPFPVERLRYLRDWASSEEYRQIKLGNYKRAVAEGAVDVKSQAPNSETEVLRRQIEELQREIDRQKSKQK